LRSQIRLLAFVPSFFGQFGDAVNERQLMMTLSGYVDYVYCVSFIRIKQIRRGYRRNSKMHLGDNVKIITLPFLKLPIPAVYLEMLAYSVVIAIFSAVLLVFRRINVIYVRETLLACGFAFIRPILKPLILLKFPSFEAEVETYRIKKPIFKHVIETFFKTIDTCALRLSNLVVTHTKFMAEEIRRRYGVNQSLFTVCPPGISLKKIARIARKVSKPLNEVRVGFIGSLTWWQGVDVLVEAMSILQKANPNLELWIVGDGPEGPKVRQLIRQLNVRSVMTGYMSHEKALEQLATFHVLVLPRKKVPSVDLNVPLKVLEAIALSVPTVVTRHEWVNRLFNEGEGIVAVEPNPNDVANKLLALVSDLAGTKLVKRGKPLVERFAYEKTCENLVTTISRLMNGRMQKP